jgi:RimJ/RimL family protein N-acetyltransferase
VALVSVSVALERQWPAELRTARLLLRPVTADDAPIVATLLTDLQVRAHLGGPASAQRVARRQREYPRTPGTWAMVPAHGAEAIGLVTITPDHRCEGRAELSYQLLPCAWGSGLGQEAACAAIRWWHRAAPDAGPLVAVTQQANRRSRRLLESLGMVLLDEFVEFDEQQCLYSPDGENSAARWARLYDSRREEVERRRGAQMRATAMGAALPEDLSGLDFEELMRTCPARHGAHGRICARTADHDPEELHLGRADDGGWIAWLGDADHAGR